jgi:Na+-transporting NADH:ubiquinone oxidoreductase subunit A
MGKKLETKLQIATGTVPASGLNEVKSVSRVAVLARDYQGVNFELLVKQGDQVSAGSALMRDARRPSIVFTSPGTGNVVKIERGSRRKLISLQIDLDETPGTTRYKPPAKQERAPLRAFMLESGAWTSLRTRPFDNIPNPDGEPAALFITAIESEPLAPEPRSIIDTFIEEFRTGVRALAGISEAPVYLCHAVDYVPTIDESEQLHCVPFAAGHSAGLPGVHINALCPIGFGGGEVWHIGYQDVISLGHLLLNGTPWLERVITIGGAAIQQPRSLRVSPGASIDQLLAGETRDGPVRVFSGSVIRGQAAVEGQAYLGARHRQITVLAETDISSRAGQPGTVGVLIPNDELEALAPPGIYPVPLMRALQVGDVDRARELGALELVEEDLALLSHACLSKCDYGLLLRHVLNQLEGAG